MAIEVNATPRATQGKGASRRLRRHERVPGVLYGGGRPAQNIEMDHKELALHLKHEAFQASILTLNVGGEKQQVLLRSEEHTSELQSLRHLVCRLLLEKK